MENILSTNEISHRELFSISKEMKKMQFLLPWPADILIRNENETFKEGRQKDV